MARKTLLYNVSIFWGEVKLAKELVIHPEMIYRWRREYETGVPSFPARGNERLSQEQKELELIKQENADLRMERDILKKAIGIFSRKNGCFINLWLIINISIPSKRCRRCSGSAVVDITVGGEGR
jgi:transposase